MGRRSIAVISIATLGLAGLIWAGPDLIRPEALRFSFADNVNVVDRSRYWKEAVQAIAERPLGYGVGVEDRAFGAIVGDQKRASAHNDWLDYGLGMGVAGMILAIAVFGKMYSALWKGTSTVKRKWLGVGVRATLVFFGVCSVSGQVFSFARLPFLVFAAQIALVNGISRPAGHRFRGLRHSRPLVDSTVFPRSARPRGDAAPVRSV
jgi:O-antigen ligase